MSYTVLLHPKAAEFIAKVDDSLASRIKERLHELKNEPEKIGKPLRYTDNYSLRIGEYRAIYFINVDEKQVIVQFIGNRKNVYDDFSKLF